MLRTVATLHQREPERGWTREQKEELLVGVGRGTDVQRLGEGQAMAAPGKAECRGWELWEGSEETGVLSCRTGPMKRPGVEPSCFCLTSSLLSLGR